MAATQQRRTARAGTRAAAGGTPTPSTADPAIPSRGGRPAGGAHPSDGAERTDGAQAAGGGRTTGSSAASGAGRTTGGSAASGGGKPSTGRRRSGRLASGPAIREAAIRLFLERGYQGTSMDDIAAAARVSKQTIYTHFSDKETLFAELVLGNVERVEEFAGRLRQVAEGDPDPEQGLQALARLYAQFVIRPQVVLLRRLVLAEAGRFPELAREYYQQVPERVYRALADLLQEFAARGALRVPDPYLAAHHFAWLVLGLPLDRAMFDGGPPAGQPSLDEIADAGVRVFLAAYAAR